MIGEAASRSDMAGNLMPGPNLHKRRFGQTAFGLGVLATGVEPTTGGWVKGISDLT